MATQLPFPKRVSDAVDRIGTTNGTKIADADVPESVRADNVEANDWFNKFSAVREFLVAALVKKRAESRYDAAKKVINTVLPISDLAAGDSKSYVFGTVSLGVRSQNGQRRINRQKLITKLMVDQKLPLTEAGAFIDACEDQSAPSIYLTPATVAE